MPAERRRVRAMVESAMTARADWTWGVASSPAEMEEVDDAWAQATSPAERLTLVLELSSAFDWSDDVDPASARFLGADCGVRRLRG